MPDDDPIEDLQRAGMTAGAAGARAVEAALRSRQQQQPQSVERHHQQSESPEQVANRAESRRLTAEFEDRLDSAKEWARAERPELLELLSESHSSAESRQGHLSADESLIRSWERETGNKPRTAATLEDPDTRRTKDEPVTEAQQWTLNQAGVETPGTKGEASKLIRDMYDTPEGRAGRHDAMEVAGVPLEARQAAVTADKMNGADPALAAASGAKQKAHRRTGQKVPQRERGR